ncbi:MAG: hypothetical protein QF362_01250 [Candidatus Woesearchaeota archaeon]|jgi:endogenous inhibitor of DNA gyrase (YacG/DUF329 family)|nr:hypothetical protein [Candidatus Woesearchaeota archaeon]MDP7610526.1 hypothetical protein [Candidatus Woesearchaeota archaeon]|tara:strand:+ start:1926 stop:2309 length:384 start_codon:yes stop_codon:yes gene_type:complete
MYIPKRYGQSKVNNCPFCGKTAIIKNSQKIPVCEKHKKTKLVDLKCICGEWLDLNSSKWGAYFRCINCGNINFKKGLEMNPDLKFESEEKEVSQKDKKDVFEKIKPVIKKKKPVEIVVRSDEVDFLY